jgi:hypothetical protein
MPARPPRPLAPRVALAGGLLAALAGGCAPSVTPLYRDFEVRPGTVAADTADLRGRLRAALVDAGWTLAPAVTPEAVATAPRTVSDVGLYRTEVHLDAVPVGGRYVRVFFHPYRRYLSGGRSKVPYLGAGLRRRLLPPLADALARRGLVAVGLARERDEEATNED